MASERSVCVTNFDQNFPSHPGHSHIGDRKSDWSCREKKRNRRTLVMAVARRALPRMVVAVLVIKLGCDGSLSTISDARSAGGGGFNCFFEGDEAIVRLYDKGKRSEQIGVIKKSKQARRRTKRGFARRPHEVVHGVHATLSEKK
jgi:hypothetical protein